MKKLKHNLFIHIAITLGLVFSATVGLADDTCVFAVTADDVPPNIVILLDNGAAMEQIIWHRLYDNSVDYTPARDGIDNDIDGTIDEFDELKFEDIALSNNAAANGFFWDNGYTIIRSGNKYFILPINDDLTYGGLGGLEAPVSAPTFTINTKTITLPYLPSAALDASGIIDGATIFRYSKNYMNWLFFGPYAGTGADLPRISRFYYAKKAIFSVARLTANQAQFGVNNFTSAAAGSSNVQPLGMVVNTPLAADPANNTLDPNFKNTINNMGTVNYSPLAEGLASLGGYYASPSSGVVAEYCQKNFALVVTPGLSSQDQAVAAGSKPTSLSDYDADNAGIGEGNVNEDANTYAIPVNFNGSTYLDDVAHWLFTNDVVGYRDGFQNVQTYTVGFMGDAVSNLFLINTSNNGNGNKNLYDTSHEEYGKYHFTAQSPDDLAAQMMAAVTDIISKTTAFTAPVVPVTRTTSGNRVYMAFFKPGDENFWEGNVTKFGLSADNEIVDAQSPPQAATYPNGAIKEDAVPYWATKTWADPAASNFMDNRTGFADSRNIYTYLGATTDLTHASNAFVPANAELTAAVLGAPTHTTAEIINYVRGADVFDDDNDTDVTENRAMITGDVLHSEPVVFQYDYRDGSSKKMVYFGSNDGMLHAVLDETVDAGGTVTSYGTEAWAFIPPDQLHRLKDLVESASHPYYLDSTPKVYFLDVNKNNILEGDGDVDGNGTQDDLDGDGDVDTDDKDRVILVCGERKGGTCYFALDVTDPAVPKYLWRINRYYDNRVGTIRLTAVNGAWQDNDFGDHFPCDDPTLCGFDRYILVDGAPVGAAPNVVLRYDYRTFYPLEVGHKIFAYRAGTGYTDNVFGTVAAISFDAPYATPPTNVIAELGETWSEPKFGRVKTSATDAVGTLVVFVGGGYSANNTRGNALIAINALTGAVVKKFATGFSTPGMSYSVPSAVNVIDLNSNGFIDKVYVGDLGGQMWRFGRYTDAGGVALPYPATNENINDWTGQVLFLTDTAHSRKFYYPPTVTPEVGFDLVFMGTGDRENACCENDTVACSSPAPNFIGAVKDAHSTTTIIGETEAAGVYSARELVDITDPASTPPNLNVAGDVDGNTYIDQGWYIRLVDASGDAVGEKALGESQVFFKVFYITTFTPNDEPCLPGGESKLWALQYLSGAAVLDLDSNGTLDRNMVIGGGIASKPVLVLTEDSAKLLISVGSTNPDASSEDTGAGILTEDPLAPDLNFFYRWWREF